MPPWAVSPVWPLEETDSKRRVESQGTVVTLLVEFSPVVAGASVGTWAWVARFPWAVRFPPAATGRPAELLRMVGRVREVVESLREPAATWQTPEARRAAVLILGVAG